LLGFSVALRTAQQAVLVENTAWTSRLASLEGSLRDARLTVSKSQKEQQQELENQWVKSPVAGTVSDIRVTGVTTKGVTLEVMILEQDNNEKASTKF
jgi:hypothetical protein